MNKEIIRKIYNQGDLEFIWQAYKKDGSILSQFEEVDNELKENLFTEIDNSPERFKKFELVSINNPDKKYSVDLETGNFIFDRVLIKNNIDISKHQLKCIFWRRKAITINLAISKESSRYLFYIIGWNTNINGANIKKEYRIFADLSVQEIFVKQSRQLYAQAKLINNI